MKTAMTLPDVNVSKLQNRIKEVEANTPYPTFSKLCSAVAQTGWAKGQGLKATAIGDLIRHHRLTCVTQIDDLVSDDDEPVAAPEPDTEEEPEPEDAPAVKLYDEPAKGRKQCPACHKYVWIGAPKCACRHTFKMKKKAPTPRSEPTADYEPSLPPERDRYRHLTQITAPAGVCPVTLKGTDEQTVLEWANEVREHFITERKFMTVAALVYFARYSYDINGPEHRQVKAILTSALGAESE